ncbi:hypothetical protein FRC96_18955 [Lujinxingia vulgaris]|uniref:Outer membrane protein beta-barrel domain-containing protein n=1 Tax=Lujinxingia vulgaris TaxID=2600176 RepID=A0A5C6X656_9DELT|nr:hypothetical protein [Lujinxingia vulgaris]TXD32076.1 hypothetical protein FRC96_18955 [Lujinxingia vulgaris]
MTNPTRTLPTLALLGVLTGLLLPTLAQAQHDESVPWHLPSTRDTPPPERPPSLAVFVEPAMAASAVGGRFYGYDPSLRIYVTGQRFGIHAGITSVTPLNVRDWEGPLFYVGATLNPLGGLHLGSPSPNLNLFLLGPRLGLNASYSRTNAGLGLGVELAPTGLRVARCEPICMFAELRPFNVQYTSTHADVFYSRLVNSRQISASLALGLAF